MHVGWLCRALWCVCVCVCVCWRGNSGRACCAVGIRSGGLIIACSAQASKAAELFVGSFRMRDVGNVNLKVSGAAAGDWSCPDCASHNFARRMECFRCGAPRRAHMGFLHGARVGMCNVHGRLHVFMNAEAQSVDSAVSVVHIYRAWKVHVWCAKELQGQSGVFDKHAFGELMSNRSAWSSIIETSVICQACLEAGSECASQHMVTFTTIAFFAATGRPEGTMGAVPAYNRGRPYEQRQGDLLLALFPGDWQL